MFLALPPTHLVFVNLPAVSTGKLPVFEVVAEDSTGHQVFTVYTVTLSAAQISGTTTETSTSTSPAVFGDVTIPQTEELTASSPGLTAAVAMITVGTGVPTTYFGMHVLGFQQQFAPLGFQTVHSWDTTNYYGVGPDWAESNTSSGEFNFAALDQFLLQNQGKDVVYDLGGRTPPWASTIPSQTGCTYGPGQCAPPTEAAWKAWVAAVTAHEGQNITYYELWNEPNYSGTWVGDIPTMVTMAKDAYQIIHANNPHAVVLSPAAAGTNGIPWMKSFIAVGGAATFDVLAFHGYTSPAGIAEGETALVSGYAPLAGGKPLWDTELGWNDTNLSLAQEQAFVARVYLLQWPAVARVIWYAYDSGPQWGSMWSPTGGQNIVATAYSQVENWMLGATVQPCVQVSGVYTCQITRTGYAAEAVWVPGKTAAFDVPAGMTRYRDLSGFVHSTTAGGSVTIGDSPILLETGAVQP